MSVPKDYAIYNSIISTTVSNLHQSPVTIEVEWLKLSVTGVLFMLFH